MGLTATSPESDFPTALQVKAATTPPPSINPYLRRPAPRPLPDPEVLFAQIQAGDTAALSRGITLIESALPAHRRLAADLLSLALQNPSKAIRIGITGVPGVGKSTLIEALGLWLADQGHRIAVLAVDPSSSVTGGSILGDKSRMAKLANHDSAFVRPSPTGGALGGVAHQTRESISLCEAAGFDVVLVETVGVGQSETAVYNLVDCFLLLMLGGAGDELQGIKRGIMESADVIAVTKSDGDNRVRAEIAAGQVRAALHFVAPRASGWTTDVLCCSSQTHEGILELWTAVSRYFDHAHGQGLFDQRRREQAVRWLRDLVEESVLQTWRSKPGRAELQAELERKVRAGILTPRSAAERLISG